MKKQLWPFLIPPAVVLLTGAAMLFLFDHPVSAAIVFGLGVITFLIAFDASVKYRREARKELDDIFNNNSMAATGVINDLDVPCLLYMPNGRIIWRNAAFERIYRGNSLKEIKGGKIDLTADITQQLDYQGRSFQLHNISVERDGGVKRSIGFQYWIDRTEATHYARLYTEHVPAVALIYVDNIDELAAGEGFAEDDMRADMERLIGEFAETVDGFCKRIDAMRFIVIFESSHIAELEAERFQALFENSKKVFTGTNSAVSLSVAVGVEDRLAASDESARHAMELALGRGGNQAVVKKGTAYFFYDGGQKDTVSSRSKVKTRLFASALRQMMENSANVYIMGHDNPDMDCIGAALGLFRCAKIARANAGFILKEDNPMIETVCEEIRHNHLYGGFLVAPEKFQKTGRYTDNHDRDMLIIVDTQRESTVAAPELLKLFKKKVVIDHHRRALDVIPDITLEFLEPNVSSASEMVTEIIQYFDSNPKLTGTESSALLAGISLDTRNFTQNTGFRTFEAAGYLRRNKASINAVKQMFKDDIQTYIDRAHIVESAVIHRREIAIAVCPDESGALLAAQAADTLISIKGISASFVLIDEGDGVKISGRSIGKINVQLILEMLGGGGHFNVAAAKLADVSLQEAMERLTAATDEYLERAYPELMQESD